MNTKTADVVIIGGGIQGVATAWNLALAGVSCVVLEKDYIGRHASGVNAGGVRRLGRDLEELPLSVRAAEIWPMLDQLLSSDTGFHASRQIKVAESEQDLKTLEARRQLLLSQGYDHEKMIDQQQLRELLPAVSHHCLGALTVEGDGSAIPFKTTTAFARAAKRQGVSIYESVEVESITRSADSWLVSAGSQSFSCHTLVNCAGAWGDKIAAMVGDKIPLEPAALMLMISQRLPKFMEGVVGSASRALSFKQFSNGTVLIGGAHRGRVDRDHNRATTRIEGLAENAAIACDLFPVMKNARLVRSWAGIEGMMPDRLPVIGHGSADNVIHCFGFSDHGFQLGPAVGELVAALVLKQDYAITNEAFRPQRFDRALAV